MSENKKVSVIIPHFNTIKLLEKNLPTVIQATQNELNNIVEIILVDDGSVDDSAKMVKKRFPEIKVIRHKINRGFSAAVNTGARHAKGDLLVLLNTDAVPSRDFLVSALRLMDGNVFAITFHESGYGPGIAKFHSGFIQQEKGRENKKVQDTFWVSGGSGIFRSDVWKKLGGMDEKILSPLYWEDFDLSYRATKRGYRLLWDPNAKVAHEHESTVSKLPRKYLQKIQERNYLLVHWKNITSPSLFRRHLIGLVKRIVQKPGYVKVVFSTIGRIRLVVRARKKEKKEGKVSDEAIFSRFN